MITFVGQTAVKHLSSFRDRMKVDPVSQIVIIALFDRQLSRVTQVQTDLLLHGVREQKRMRNINKYT